MYRLSETKSVQIGKIVRFLKENAIDCLLNVEQNELIESVLKKNPFKNYQQEAKFNFQLDIKTIVKFVIS